MISDANQRDGGGGSSAIRTDISKACRKVRAKTGPLIRKGLLAAGSNPKRNLANPIPELSAWNRHAFGRGVKPGKPHECWEWTRSTADGYGRIKIDKKVYSAHRVAYTLAHGPIRSAEAVVMHTCDNRKCCNPAHLRLGTPRDNARDMVAKGRQYQPQPLHPRPPA
jgi:hypothetical protein